jgi:hypothetical protein
MPPLPENGLQEKRAAEATLDSLRTNQTEVHLLLIGAAFRPISNSVPMLKLDRHPLGVRVYVLRHRIHEWHAGLAVLAFAAAPAFWACSARRLRCSSASPGSGWSQRTGTT